MQFLMMRLKHSTTAQDELSETTASNFVRGTGSMDVEDFIKTFQEQRVTYHKRMIWGEQWTAGKVTWPTD